MWVLKDMFISFKEKIYVKKLVFLYILDVKNLKDKCCVEKYEISNLENVCRVRKVDVESKV